MSDKLLQFLRVPFPEEADENFEATIPAWIVAPLSEAADHIEALEARIRELEAERDNLADKVRWMDPLIKEHHDAGQVYWEKWQAAEAHAQKLREALDNIRDAANSFRDEEGYEVAGQVRIRVDAALALTPTSSLAAVRDEVLEEAAKIAEQWECSNCNGHFHPDDNCSCDRPSWNGPLVSYQIAATIRARKETGE